MPHLFLLFVIAALGVAPAFYLSLWLFVDSVSSKLVLEILLLHLKLSNILKKKKEILEVYDFLLLGRCLATDLLDFFSIWR